MKIAVISDIHANLPALETVLAHIQEQGIQHVWNAGDLIGYGAFPDQVITLIQSLNIPSIIGNYDQKVLKFPQKAAKWVDRKKPNKFLAFKWAYQQLSPNSLAYLWALPEELRFTINGYAILITHGSPASNEEHIGPLTPAKRLIELANLAQADIIICGHSHQPFCREIQGIWFLNPGSVGRPDDGDPRASYAVLNLEPSHISVTHYRLAYDIDRAVEGVRQAGLPEVFAQMLIQGRNLDAMNPQGEL